MIIKKYILNALNKLDNEYNRALTLPDPIYATYFAKLAVLEYCGWLEEALDIIVKRSIKNKLQTIPFQDIINSTIQNNYGFQYKENFRPMLIDAIGIVEMEKLQLKLERNSQISILISELEAIKRDRNSAAHTWIKDVTVTYPAPSNIIGRFNRVYPILKKIYREIILI